MMVHAMPSRWIAAAAALVLAAPVAAAPRANGWVASWASSQMIADDANALPAIGAEGATLRQIVRLSAGGARVRLRLSNAFGTEPLRIAAVHLARAMRPGDAAVEAGSDRTVLFGGAGAVTIPAGAEVLSDPVAIAVPSRADLAVSLVLPALPGRQTGHPGSRATSFLVAGDLAGAARLPAATRVEHWFQLAGVEVEAAPGTNVAVMFGDSITDGHGATTDGNDRWPDVLAARLAAAGRKVAVLNAGIGGNRLLLDGTGPNALARFDRDVLSPPGVRTLVVLEGINDLGNATRLHAITPAEHQAVVTAITGAYAQIVARAHAHGIAAYGATLLPFTGSDYYHPDAAAEADRQAINRWIRTPGHFDGVVDFDRVTADPAHPERMLPRYDSGDHLHPSPAGYAAMGAAVPLGWFTR